MRIVAALFLLFAINPIARANYVCAVAHLSAEYLGVGGALHISDSAQPDCAGGVTTRLVCSAGATHFQCGKTMNFSAAAIQAHFGALNDAALSDQFVQYALGACYSGNANNCVLGVTFLNPAN